MLSSVQRLLTTVQTVALSPVSSAPYHHLPTPPRTSSQPFSTPLPQNTRPNSPPPEPLPTPETKAPKRRIQANPNPVPPAMRASANTCHDLLVIGPQRQNPCCRTLALTCADAGCPSTPGSHDFGPPRQQAGTMNPPKNPTPNDPLLRPSGANTDRPTRARCPPCSPNPTPPHIHSVPHHKTPPRFQNPRLTDLSTSQSAPPDPPETITIVCSPEPPERKTAHHMVALPPRPESHM